MKRTGNQPVLFFKLRFSINVGIIGIIDDFYFFDCYNDGIVDK